ncbi:pyridoxamine 5'-phosphate oxidase family protein [Halosimplex rubrum]|uniref:Pyridoxamine 5'-phosphate oxidase family protein n=1 Tax=Halosimplex rubrum TaxID=869889 RepID=A0A7D5P4P7_9EURY|nr:pyridoxamine 5'-phosphate oxidase family protein [Halosimplex rubrum]QLH79061.1 pyridoxamine 5'-phosphate oxidase family protein [Halosimplex rubrum]
METVTGDWDRDRTEQFLDERTIPVRLATHTPGGGLWMLSLWYRYRDGHLECATGANAKVVRYLRENPAVAFEISTNDVPYRGVRGAGTADIAPDEDKTVLRDLVERYLGDTDSKLARRLLSPDRDEVRIRVDVDRAYTWDFSDRMGEGE